MRLRSIREKHGLSVRDLAEKSRLSKTSIMNLEHGHSCRPVTIMKVCAALGLHIERFLQPPAHEEPQLPAIHRREDDRWYDLNGLSSGPLGGLDRPATDLEREQFHKHGLGAQMLMFQSRLSASSSIPGIIELTQSSEARSHPGEEFVYVLDGMLKMEIGSKQYELGQGESMSFDPNVSHNYAPGSKCKKVTFLCFRSHPTGT